MDEDRFAEDEHDCFNPFPVATLGSPAGGLWLTAEVDEGVPLENIEAICQALEKYRSYFRGK